MSASLSDTWGASDGSGWESLGGTRWGVSANTSFPPFPGSTAPSPEATGAPNPAQSSSSPLQPQRNVWLPSETRPVPVRPPVVGLLPLVPLGAAHSGSFGPPPAPPPLPPPLPLPLLPPRRTGEERWGGLPRASAFTEREGGYAAEDPGAGCGDESAVVEVRGVGEVEMEGGRVEKEEEHEEGRQEEVPEKEDDKQEVDEQEMEEMEEQEMKEMEEQEMEEEEQEVEEQGIEEMEQEHDQYVGDAGGAGTMRASLDDVPVPPPGVAALAAEVEAERSEGDADERLGTGEDWGGLAAADAAQGSGVTVPGGGTGSSPDSISVSVEAGQAGVEGACWPGRCASARAVLGASGQGEPPPSSSSGSGGSDGGDGGSSGAGLEDAFDDIGDDSPAVGQPEHIDGGGEEAPGELTAENNTATATAAAAATTTAAAIIEEQTRVFSQPSVPFLDAIAVSEPPTEPPVDGADASDRAEQDGLVTALPSVSAVVEGGAPRQEDGGMER